MSIFGHPNLDKMVEKRDITGIAKLLTDKNWKIRYDSTIACEKLAPYFNMPPASADEIQYHWPWSLDKVISKNLVNIPLNADETIIGIPLPVKYRDDPSHHIGLRGTALLAGMCEKYEPWAGSRHPSWNFLALILTDQRVIVVAHRWATMVKPFWEESLENLREANILKEDDKFIELKFNDSRYGVDELVFNPLDEMDTNFTDMKKRDLPDWLKECNHFLQLFHKKDKALNLYLQYNRAIKNGVLIIIDALIKNLHDEQPEVNRAATSAIKTIGGVQAENAVRNL